MANLDLFGGISFDKGCYTGQEIIARLHYLGTLKRRLFIARIEGDAPVPGRAVHQAGDSQPVGEIVDTLADAAGSIATVVHQLAPPDAETIEDTSTVTAQTVTGPHTSCARTMDPHKITPHKQT